eukprot:1048717-Karenia_brevis.AAC.1
MAGTPLTWSKVSGGFEFEWIWYWQHLQRFQVGITASRTTWLQRWALQLLQSPVCWVRTVVEGVGRLSYTMTAVPMLR